MKREAVLEATGVVLVTMLSSYARPIGAGRPLGLSAARPSPRGGVKVGCQDVLERQGRLPGRA